MSYLVLIPAVCAILWLPSCEPSARISRVTQRHGQLLVRLDQGADGRYGIDRVYLVRLGGKEPTADLTLPAETGVRYLLDPAEHLLLAAETEPVSGPEELKLALPLTKADPEASYLLVACHQSRGRLDFKDSRDVTRLVRRVLIRSESP